MLVRPLGTNRLDDARRDDVAREQRDLDGTELDRVAADLLHRVVPTENLERAVGEQPAPIASVVQPRVDHRVANVLPGMDELWQGRHGGRPWREALAGEIGPVEIAQAERRAGDKDLARHA
eukprot:4624909-Prymnesium_polylepis.3